MNKDFLLFHKPFISEEEINEIDDTVGSGWLSMGPKTIRFEEEFTNYIGSNRSIPVNSWTAAGHLTLEAFGINRGDEVIVPTMTFPATTEIVCFSFYATKTLSTGEGGMICTNNEDIADRYKIMRLHGINRDAWKRYSEAGSWYYEVVALGFKYNFTDLQASLGLPQLKKVDFMWGCREKIARLYTEAFKDNELIELHTIKPNRESSWHLYPIRLNLEKLKINRAQFIEELKNLNLGVGVHFMPVHQHMYYKNEFNLEDKNYPVASKIFPRLVSLPIYPGMSKEHVNKVINIVSDTLNKYKK